MYDGEDNDGKFSNESPVEVRYPRSKQEEQGNREQWPLTVQRCLAVLVIPTAGNRDRDPPSAC